MRTNKRGSADPSTIVSIDSPCDKDLYGAPKVYGSIHLRARVSFDFQKILRLAIPYAWRDHPYIVEDAPNDVRVNRDQKGNIKEVVITLQPDESVRLRTNQYHTMEITLMAIKPITRNQVSYELQILES